jgi:hypothetical protein
MERYPQENAEQNDGRSDLDPEDSAELSERDFNTRSPGLGQLISDRFDKSRHEPQPGLDPLGMIDEGREDQRPGRDHGEKAEGVRFRELAECRMAAGLNGQHKRICAFSAGAS